MDYAAFFEQPIILEDDLVRIEPLGEKHYDLLLPTALEPSLWLYTVAKISSPEAFRRYFDTALKEKSEQRSYPFAYYHKQQQRYVGSTRYANIEFPNKKLEIGWTWIHPSMQGTGFNKHCKFLLLSYGFETLGLNRIELKTSHLNLKSQKAMRKIGAVEEGTFRKNIINDDGTIRNTVYFSFINDEWPEIKNRIFREFIK
ncbi:MAG TPA: GNAT family protein [Ferruginibacter sp.]|nr:GNAT family protein [Ferruginibacter sp.]